MKQAACAQKLELADRFFADILSGTKTHTLRWNDGEIVQGPLEFFSFHDTSKKLTVLVTGTRTGALRSFAGFYGTSAEELTSSMQKHYPDIVADSNVVLVEFTLNGEISR